MSVLSRRRFMTTPDGRRVAWVEHGPIDGQPVIYCHGAPGAPAEIEQFHGAELADRLGIRLVAIARPGMWYSELQPARQIIDWVVDAVAVADACRFTTFRLLGYSAGASYATAVAAAVPHRVTAVSMVAPVDHHDPRASERLDRLSLWAQRQALERPRPTRIVMAGAFATPLWRPLLRLVLEHTPLLRRPDHLALRDRRVRESVVHKAEQAYRAGPAGPQHDVALMMQNWGVDVAAVCVPVSIWQGTRDTLGSTVAMAMSLHQRIAGSALMLVDDGHLSTMTVHAPAILARLLTSGPDDR